MASLTCTSEFLLTLKSKLSHFYQQSQMRNACLGIRDNLNPTHTRITFTPNTQSKGEQEVLELDKAQVIKGLTLSAWMCCCFPATRSSSGCTAPFHGPARTQHLQCCPAPGWGLMGTGKQVKLGHCQRNSHHPNSSSCRKAPKPTEWVPLNESCGAWENWKQSAVGR